MKTFTDSAGRTWTVNITVDAIKRVKDLVGVNLADVTEGDDSEGPPLMTKLATDVVLLCDVIYAVIKPQADQHPSGVTDEQFGQALGGEAIQAAHEAFWEALADFFHQLRRADQVRAIRKQQALIRAAVEAADRQIEDIEIDRMIDLAMEEEEPPPRWAEGKNAETPEGGNSSGSSPASSPSTRDR